MRRPSHRSSVGKSIAKRMPGTALWEDLFAVLLGRALRSRYPEQLFGKTFSSQFCWEERCKEDARHSFFGKTFSLQFCWEEHCKEDTRHSSLGRPSLCSSVGKTIAKRIPGTALWEDLLFAVLLGRALQRGYPAQLFGKTFSLQFCWEEHCKEDTRHSSLGRPSLCSSVGKSIPNRIPGTALWEDLLFAVLLGKALQRGYPAQLFEKTFSLQFCWGEHCKEDTRRSSLGRLSHCSSVGKSIAKRIPGTALSEDLLFAVLLGRALQTGYPAQLFGKTFSLQFCWEGHCKEDTRHSSLGRPSHRSSFGKSIAKRIPGTAFLGRLSHCSSVGKSIAKRIPGTALWEDFLFAVLLGRALQRGYPAQLFRKTFSLQFCWEEHCKEDTRHSSLGRPSLCSSVGKSIANRIPGTALWEDLLFAVLLGRALRRGYPAQLFGKTFSLQFCWENHCKEDTRHSSLGRPSLCSSVGKTIAKRIPGTALWEGFFIAVLLGRALQRGYPAQLFGKTFSLQFCWEEHCKEDTRHSSLGRPSLCSSVGKSIAKRIPGTALWEDLLFAVLLGRALQRGYPAQLFGKTFSLQLCWEEHCKELESM